jgi:hypothetical protein
MKARFSLLPLLFLCLICMGCVQRSIENDITIFHYNHWQLTLSLLAGIILIVVTYKYWSDLSSKWRGLLLLGAAVLIGMSPSVYFHRVKFDSNHFEVVHGPWWATKTQSIRFTDISQIQVVEEVRDNALGKESTYRLYKCQFRNGESERIPRGELMSHAEKDIYRLASDKGVLCPE